MVKILFDNKPMDLKPSKIICMAKNYRKHAAEFHSDVPKTPEFFLKPPTSLIEHDSQIILPPLSHRVDYESELAVIIKKDGKNIDIDKVEDYILGYTVFLDITARDIQAKAMKEGMPWTISKSFDTFAPIGPKIVKDMDVNDLEIGLKVNGEVKQLSSTKYMVFKVDKLVSYISEIMTLKKFDIIATGTPEGIGPIKSGNKIEAWVEGIGTLIEYVV